MRGRQGVLQVQVYKAYGQELGQQDYLVMATDGLWDVLTNEEVGGLTGHTRGHVSCPNCYV